MLGNFYCADGVGVAYLEIHKCACTSAKNLIAYLEDENRIGNLNPFDVHVKYNELFSSIKSKNDKTINNYFRFTFVRNPIERFISFYQDKILTIKDEYTWAYLHQRGFVEDMSIDDVVSQMIKLSNDDWDPHFAPQSQFLLDNGRLVVDFIGRLERKTLDWKRVIKLLGLEVDVPHFNVQKKEKLSPSDMSDKSLGLLKKFYREDMLLLGY